MSDFHNEIEEELTIPPTKLGFYLYINNINYIELSEEIGISRQFMYQLVWGKRNSIDVLTKIAKHLEVELEDIRND
jgi:DNA-binding Xre family transcriptional regulator